MNVQTGTERDATAATALTYGFTFGVYDQAGPWDDRRQMSWAELNSMLTRHAIGPKEGTCIVPAVFSGTRRRKTDAQCIGVAFLDSDAGATLDEIRTAVQAQGWAAIISSTHSHLSTRTVAKPGNWDKFRAKAHEHDLAPAAFLMEEKGYLPRVAQGARVVAETDEQVTLEHQPCPKFRIAIPLLRPWLATSYDDQHSANAAWKERIEALAATLGLAHDQACTDTSRLFFLPRRPLDGPLPQTAVLEGGPCDIFALPQAVSEDRAQTGMATRGTGSKRRRGARDGVPEFVDPDTGEVLDLAAWARDHGRTFEIVSALRARHTDIFVHRPSEGNKHHIRCVNEGEHTQAGKDAATFIMNASATSNEGFAYHCRHGHCDGRDRLFFLRTMLEQGWLTVADLNDPKFRTDDAAFWPEPVDFLADSNLTGAPVLRPEHLPEALFPFVMDTATRMGVDPASIALATLVACASVANDAWQIQPKQRDDTWTEGPRLWGAIVGDPSILKTPVIRACTAPIDRLDAEARRLHTSEMRKHQEDMLAWKAAGSESSSMPRPPLLDRYMVEGTTIEALSEALRDDLDAKQRAPAGKVLVRQDEMSEWIAGFDRYRSGGKGGGDRGAYLRLYNGGRYTVDRINRGSFAVPNWSACVLGGIQPEPIQRIAREAADDGLLQRFIYCVPSRQDEGEDCAPCRDALCRYEALIPALLALRPPSATFAGMLIPGSSQASGVVLHADAHRHRMAVNDLARAMAAMPDTSNRLKAAFGKWPGLFARLALTFHLIEVADANARRVQAPPLTVVSEATACRAANYLRDILLPHTLRAEAVMFSTAQTGHARWIAGYILAKGQPHVTLRDVVQAYGALRAPEDRRELLDVMESLVTVGWLQPGPQSNPTRPPAAWTINPAVKTVFAAHAEQERERRRKAQRQLADVVAALAHKKRS